jgi:single-strand DNA-binding protein
MLIGNLGTDPQQREARDQKVTNFPVAVNERWTDNDGERKERTIWYRVAAWGRLGEICAEHLAKGRKVYVEGRLIADEETGGPRAWTRDDGGPGAAFELRADRIEFIDAHGEGLQEELVEKEAWRAELSKGSPSESPQGTKDGMTIHWMLWQNGGHDAGLDEAVDEAVGYYCDKYGRAPNRIQVPEDFPEGVLVSGMLIERARNVLPGHLMLSYDPEVSSNNQLA